VPLDAELRATAERKAEAILDEARAEAARLASDAERSVGDRREKRLRAKEAEYTAEARQAVAAEKHAAMEGELLARTRVVERVIERVKALVPELARSDAYASTLPRELARALEFVEGEDILVRCSEELAEPVREALSDRPEISIDSQGALGAGFVVAGDGGSVLVDSRLESRVDRLASMLAIEIHSRLQQEPR
jgi:vacuolar-type H+-ATPase subunit E/Vma4